VPASESARVIVVTGATSGIGHATAAMFAKAGDIV
jgi:NAD(P)-dependent dehydrogenase (short-subunit alcohol dehydrogenase family)